MLIIICPYAQNDNARGQFMVDQNWLVCRIVGLCQKSKMFTVPNDQTQKQSEKPALIEREVT